MDYFNIVGYLQGMLYPIGSVKHSYGLNSMFYWVLGMFQALDLLEMLKREEEMLGAMKELQLKVLES